MKPKYEAAIDLYERKDYSRALELFDLLQAAYRGTAKGGRYQLLYSLLLLSYG